MKRFARILTRLRARFHAWRLQSLLARWRQRREEFDEYFETADDTRFWEVADRWTGIIAIAVAGALIGLPIASWIIRDIIASR